MILPRIIARSARRFNAFSRSAAAICVTLYSSLPGNSPGYDASRAARACFVHSLAVKICRSYI